MDNLREDLNCPITLELLYDPVIAEDGHTYERSAIERWLLDNATSPVTGLVLKGQELQPNHAIRRVLDDLNQLESAVQLIPFSELDLGHGILGNGSFKNVEKAKWKGQMVALSRCRAGQSLEVEAKIMRRLGFHPHVVRFHGAARDPEGNHCLITELAQHGTLSDNLYNLEDQDASLSPEVMLEIARQVCEGMQALSAAQVVHRDLAARNILVFRPIKPDNAGSIVIKVSDFGLSSEQHYMTSRTGVSMEGLPVRYMSPEAIQRARWTEKSDVWAFGVLMWEVATLGMVPYCSCGTFLATDAAVMEAVCSGRQLPQPDGCPDDIYRIMQQCWAFKAAQRPSFTDLRGIIHKTFVGIAVSQHIASLQLHPDPSASQEGDWRRWEISSETGMVSSDGKTWTAMEDMTWNFALSPVLPAETDDGQYFVWLSLSNTFCCNSVGLVPATTRIINKRLLDAENLLLPECRHRVHLLGLKNGGGYYKCNSHDRNEMEEEATMGIRVDTATRTMTVFSYCKSSATVSNVFTLTDVPALARLAVFHVKHGLKIRILPRDECPQHPICLAGA